MKEADCGRLEGLGRIFLVFLLVFVTLPAIGSLIYGAEDSERENRDFSFALGLYNNGNYDLAIDQFRKFIEDYPDSSRLDETAFFIGESHYRLEEYAKAIVEYEVVAGVRGSKYQEDAAYLAGDSYFRLATSSEDEKAVTEGYRQALRRLMEFRQVYPESRYTPTADYVVAEILYQMNDYDNAITEYKRFENRYPENDLIASARYRIGLGYFQSENYRGAIRAMEDFFNQHGGDPNIAQAKTVVAASYFHLADSLKENGEYQSAIDELSRLTKDYPDLPETVKAREAIAELQEAITELRFNKALAFRKEGNLRDALSEFNRIDPSSKYAPQANFYMGDIYYQQKAYDLAISVFTGLLDSSEDLSYEDAVYFRVGKSYYEKEDYEQANSWYNGLITNYPASSYSGLALFDMGYSLYGRKDYAEATAIFRRVTETYPQSEAAAEAHFWWGRSLYDLKNYPEAINVLRAFIDLLPSFNSSNTLWKF